MDANRLWKEYSSLTLEEQRQVIDLLSLLRARQSARAQYDAQQTIGWSRVPFVGMWRDREDMTNGASWIRNLREREWSRFRR
jgi:uncharacterized protein YfbU (UPF0304 family)